MSNVVVCTKCGESIYICAAVGRDYASAPVRAKDFTPLHGYPSIKDGERMSCPVCGELFAQPVARGQLVLKLEGGQWWPYPPTNLGKSA